MKPTPTRLFKSEALAYIANLPEVEYKARAPTLDNSILTHLTAKVFELYDMLDHADDDSYPNHLSEGSLKNAGLSLLRRIYYVANSHNIHMAFRTDENPAPVKYPFLQVPENVLRGLSAIILKNYLLEDTAARSALISSLVCDIINNLSQLEITMNRNKPFDCRYNRGCGNLVYPDTLTGSVLALPTKYPIGTEYYE